MRKRAIIVTIVCIAICLVGIAILAFVDFKSGPRLATENFEKIEKGMTLAEVEALLGGPPGNFGRNDGGSRGPTGDGFKRPRDARQLRWHDDDNCFDIYFDARDRVIVARRGQDYVQFPREGVMSRLYWFLRNILP